MTSLGEIICQERRKRQESQETLAQAIGVSRQTILNWEKGRTLPDSASLVSIAQRYQLSFDQLIGLHTYTKRHQTWRKFASLLGILSLGAIVSGSITILVLALLFFLLTFFLIQELMLTKS